MADLWEGWERRDKPPTLFRRFTFERYAQTREFLDALSAAGQACGLHPQNINFGTTYVNVTLEASDVSRLSAAEEAFARQIAALADAQAGTGH
jgi:pterin-4a-carbinolamine dehydratase